MISESAASSSVAMSRAKRLKAEAMRKNAAAAVQDAQLRVIDPDHPGLDRTPQPLLKQSQATKGLAKRAAGRRASATTADSGSSKQPGESVSRVDSSTSSDQMGSTPDDSTTMPVENSSERSTVRASEMQSEFSSLQRQERHGDEAEGVEEAQAMSPARVDVWSAEHKRDWLFANVQITLTEMPVTMLFSRADIVVDKERREAADITAANDKYSAYCEARTKDEAGSRYCERGTTTLNAPRKSVKSRAAPPHRRFNSGVHVTPWKLHDAYAKLNAEEEADDGRGGDGEELEDDGAEAEEAIRVDDADDGDADEESVGAAQTAAPRTKSWMTAPSLLETVLIMERAVLQNSFESLQLAYRGIEMAALKDHKPEPGLAPTSNKVDRRKQAAELYGAGFLDTEADKRDDEHKEREERRRALEAEAAAEAVQESQSTQQEPRGKIRALWRFHDNVTGNRGVTAMSWNRANPDLCAVAYGGYGQPGQEGGGGVICCWSLKNAAAPERVIHLEAGASSMDFSEAHPSLLAVGGTDGSLSLFDVRRHGNVPALKSSVSTGQHTGTIWDLRWIQRGRDRGESLMTAAADGHVMEWSIRKGLERTAELMRLKRVPNQNADGNTILGGAKAAGTAKEALLSRQSGGMTFDVSPRDPIVYIVGTEDGTIHRCSKSQNENYLLDYRPHEEPVYRLRWSPFSANYFLTCSADWTSRLYHIDRPEPILRLDSGRQDAVQCVDWSPTSSTVFATGTAQGRVHIWDVGDPLQPVATHDIAGQAVTSVLFARQESPVVIAGDTRGDVTVLQLTGAEFQRNGLSDLEQEARLMDVVQKVSA